MKNRIAELRKEKKVSQSDVARALNITRQAVSLYERGEHEPKLETWKKLANFFDVSVPYLQGIEQDYSALTENTKSWIIEALNEEYFDNLNIEHPKSSSEQFSILANIVNKYIQLKRLKKFPIDFFSIKDIASYKIDPAYEYSESMNEYWIENFSFLFDDFLLVEAVNKSREKNNFFSNDKKISRLLVQSINKYMLDTLSSLGGKQALKLIKSELENNYLELITNISISNSKKEIKDAFFEFEDKTDDLEFKIEHSNIYKNK